MELNQDQSSVYYLHPSDHTGMKLVSIVFNGSNFINWKRSMTIGLTVKNKMSFVDGTLNKPNTTDDAFRSWSRCNSMVIGWIITALDPQIAASILYVDTAREVWIDLEERFGQVTSAQIYALQQEVHQISQDNIPIAEYYTQLKKVWDELDSLKPLPVCECGNCTCDLSQKFLKIQQEHRLMLFLMKLSNQYANVRSHILMMETMTNLPQVYKMLMQEQRHKEISKRSSVFPDVAAFAVERRNYNSFHNQAKGIGLGNSGSGNQNQVNNTVQRGFNNKKYFCDHCKIPGHSIERCFKLHGYPPGFKPSQPRKYAAFANQDDSTKILQSEIVVKLK
ncbi:uncharacterized protein LOC141665691 [Apium graveolens]|uniref:uncharacterized protein LOC141665691 n=1 Tax=Apium graveolens TaxID=4045 RepID=UPI003D7AB548